jgi:hypothetical protein
VTEVTMILSPFGDAHLVQVVSHKACGQRAECLCGWASRWVDDSTTAREAAAGHRSATVQPDGLHAALGCLLDLQDDLADVVMWLAECWPPDLPLPRAQGTTVMDQGHVGPGLALLVRCRDAGELVRLRDLPDAPVVASNAQDADGTRYELVTRGFGRVRIHGYRRLDPSLGEAAPPPDSE